MLSNGYVAKRLQEIADECYIGLHFDDPELAGNYASEVSGGGYQRVKGFFTEPSSRSIWLAEPCLFTGLLATRISHVTGWSDLINGDMIWWAKLPDPYNVLNGGGFQLLPGDVVLSIV